MEYLVAIVCGIIFSDEIVTGVAIVGLLVSVVGYFALSSRKKTYMLVSILLFSSVLSTKFHNQNLPVDFRQVEGQVVKTNHNSFVLKTTSIDGKGYRTKILFYDKGRLGETLRIGGIFRSPLPKMNEGNYSQALQLKARGIYAIGKIQRKQILSDPKGFYKWQGRWKTYGENAYNKTFSQPTASLLKAMIFSDTSYLENSQKVHYRVLGLSHIMAVSGLHIVLIGAFCQQIIFFITQRKKLSQIITLLVLVFYLSMIGFPIGAVRATLLFAIMTVKFYARWQLSSLEALHITACCLLIIFPYSLYSLSFLLSFGCAYSIVGLYPRLRKYSSRTDKFTDSLFLTLSVEVVIFPILMLSYHEWYPLIFVSNLLLLPFYSLIVVLDFGFFFHVFPSGMALFLQWILPPLQSLEQYLLDSLPLRWVGYGFNEYHVFVYYGCFFILLFRRKLYEEFQLLKPVLLGYLVYLFIFTAVVSFRQYHTYIEDHLYIGQGDCTLISYKGKHYLIDTGGSSYEKERLTERFLLPALRYYGISRLDGVFLSHYDWDHVGNLFDLKNEIDIPMVYVSYKDEKNEIYHNIADNFPITRLHENDVFLMDSSTKIKVLSKERNVLEENDKSMILEIEHQGKKALFLGDASWNVEEEIEGNFDILKVSHHGSRTSTSRRFLDRIQPKVAIISAGVNNSYGHPHKEVLENLEKSHVPYLVTAREGQIRLTIYQNQIKIETLNHQRPWQSEVLFQLVLAMLLFYKGLKYYELPRNLQD